FMGDSTYQNITYSYDKVGNIVTRSENGIVMSDNTVKNITHHYGYDSLYRLTQADGSIKENGTTVNSYTSTLQYSSIGTIVQKLQTVKIAGENDPSLTYSYNYSYAPNKPHAVAGINDNLTYRYDANGNMTAVYDTAKQFHRILYWDDDNRLTKTVDTTSGTSVATSYAYDAKGMRIIKDGPYGKSIYIDTGYVESGAPQTTAPIVSNHIFVGNTRVASVVKHTEEKNPATYFYASDHLGSSSVLTTQQGSYHERIEYLPYGETWVEDKAVSDGYTTPYKFTGKELDAETGLYYFGARYYDARMSRWISADPALEKYIPKPNDYDTEHDFYWYIFNDASGKLPGMGGVYNSININVYCYGGLNPVKFVDPDGKLIGYPWVSLIDVKRQKENSTANNSSQLISSRVRQNDSRLNPAGNSACLYRSLQSIAENYAGKNLTPEQINDATKALVKSKAIEEDYYVNDAVAVIKDALTRLGVDVNKLDITYKRGVGNKMPKDTTATIRCVPSFNQMISGNTNLIGHYQHGDMAGNFIWDPYNGSNPINRPVNRIDAIIIRRKEE
ncbi:MAG TPA: RHS repeat-associated core domain-containing protein, partial [Spirochaetota bacterium]|nr:RHS repeat-associated core domain-containing protein [Spirochaetota bacterium]